jgi:hypothetical protein
VTRLPLVEVSIQDAMPEALEDDVKRRKKRLKILGNARPDVDRLAADENKEK